MSPARFRVGVDHAHRVYFVRDVVTGRCRGYYETPAQALQVCKRFNRALGGAI